MVKKIFGKLFFCLEYTKLIAFLILKKVPGYNPEADLEEALKEEQAEAKSDEESSGDES
jgi:hypothetical protein